jgi:hypothetical protein
LAALFKTILPLQFVQHCHYRLFGSPFQDHPAS